MKKITLFRLLVIIPTLTFSLHISSQVVISQVYGGGGNSGTTYKNDFIELYNKGNVAVSLNGWSVQYASATGNTTAWTLQNSTALPNVTLQPGQYYLIQEAAGTGGTTNLPTADATGTLALSGTNGKVALCNSTTVLTTTDFNGASPIGSTIVDFVGYGSANVYEGTGATAVLTNTTAAIRNGDGATDTNDNKNDFTVGTPNPRNSTYSVNSAKSVTFSIPTGNYSTSQSVTLTSATANAKIYYTLDGTEPSKTKTLYTTAIEISTSTKVRAIAYDANDANPSLTTEATYTILSSVSNIAALRAATTPGYYRLNGEVILTLKSASRNSKYIQDATGAVIIDDASGIITTAYNLGDGITGITGTTAIYNGMLQFTPTVDPGAATSTGNLVTPVTVSLSELTNNQAKLVKVENVTISGSGNFAPSTSYALNSETSIVLRTQYTDLNYVSAAIPTTAQNIVGVVLIYNTTTQLIPRDLNDFSVHTAVKNPTTNSFNYKVVGNKLILNNTANGTNVEIFNALGSRIQTAKLTNNSIVLNNVSKGLYIVRVGKQSQKFML